MAAPPSDPTMGHIKYNKVELVHNIHVGSGVKVITHSTAGQETDLRIKSVKSTLHSLEGLGCDKKHLSFQTKLIHSNLYASLASLIKTRTTM